MNKQTTKSLTKKIILINDDVTVVKQWETLLKIRGINVVGVGFDGSQAVELSSKLNPDVTILDFNISEYAVFSAIKKIKQNVPCPKIIVMLGSGDSFKKSNLEKLGIKSILIKPINIKNLVREIRTK